MAREKQGITKDRLDYNAAVKRWKDSKPKRPGANRANPATKAQKSEYQNKLKSWEDRKPPSFSEFKAMNQPAKGPSVAPKKPSGKVGQGTVLKNISPKQQKKFEKKIDKVFDKIRKNAKGGKSGFGRKLLGNLKFSGSGKRTAMRGKSAYKVNRSRPTPKNK